MKVGRYTARPPEVLFRHPVDTIPSSSSLAPSRSVPKRPACPAILKHYHPDNVLSS
jgi:hypothetical protein